MVNEDNNTFGQFLDDMVMSLKQTWQEIKSEISAGINMFLSEIESFLDSTVVSLPLMDVDWQQARWFALEREVILSGDVGIHPSSTSDVILIQLPVMIRKTQGGSEVILQQDLLLLDGAFVVGVDLLFNSKSGAVGEFIEIKASRAVIIGKKAIETLTHDAKEIPSTELSKDLEQFLEKLQEPNDQAINIDIEGFHDDSFVMVLKDEQEDEHVVINDKDAVVHVGQGAATVKELDKALIYLKKSHRGEDPILRIYVNEDSS